MKCLVCHATWPEAQQPTCPQCSYDPSAPGASETARVLAAREAFKHKTTAYAPQSRVTSRDKWKPWLALGLALLLFAFWVRTCFH
jgi:hypothetical protein